MSKFVMRRLSYKGNYIEFPVKKSFASEPVVHNGITTSETLFEIDGVEIRENGSTNLLPVFFAYAPANTWIQTYYKTSQSFPNGSVETEHHHGGITEKEGFVVSYGTFLGEKSYPMTNGYFDKERVRIISSDFLTIIENVEISETPSMRRNSTEKWVHHKKEVKIEEDSCELTHEELILMTKAFERDCPEIDLLNGEN